MPKYDDLLVEVKELNAMHLGNVYQHYKRRTRYMLTGFSTFKESGESDNDERIVVHYVDSKMNPHTRFKDDFFEWIEYEGLHVPRFARVSQIW